MYALAACKLTCADGLLFIDCKGNPFKVIFTIGPSWSNQLQFSPPLDVFSQPAFASNFYEGTPPLPKELMLAQEPQFDKLRMFFYFSTNRDCTGFKLMTVCGTLIWLSRLFAPPASVLPCFYFLFRFFFSVVFVFCASFSSLINSASF